MNALELTLIILGVIVIIISCILVDKSKNLSAEATIRNISLEDSLSDEDKLKLKNMADELLSQSSEEVIVKTDDTLSKISNEKIMAVNEFSEQILEKISRNHEEVIFLYNMLNDKEKELKSAVKEIDSSKRKVQDILETKTTNNSIKAVKDTKTQAAAKPATQASQIEKTVKTVEKKPDIIENEPISNTSSTNNNEQILSLYSQGKSVMEISKLLNLGQGEVKLVIELFKGKK